MKKILVPTDFSDCAAHATELGFAFAEFFDADLYLFASIDIPTNWFELSAEEQDQLSSTKQLVKNTNTLLKEWKDRAARDGIRLHMILTGEKLLKGLQNEVEKNNIDFIVMGSHGASGKDEYFIGSNTQKAVRKLHVPIFIVKNKLKEYAFRNVIFASNFDAKEKEPFQHFLDFIKWFTPEKIHLLAINTTGWFGQPSLLMHEAMKDFKAMCGDRPCETHFYRDMSVDVGIRHFAEEIDADLIVISNHNRRPLKRIFSGSNVEALVNHTEVPILSIDYKEEKVKKPKEKMTL